LRVNRYTYRLQWLPDYGEYTGVCVEIPYLRREAPTPQLAAAAIEWIVQKLSGRAPNSTFGLSGYD
jgi:hypothetical protein